MWSRMSSFNPETIILLGDSIYADKRGSKPLTHFVAATPDEIKNKYKTLINDRTFLDMVEKVGGWDSIAATFDDHDYGINNGDKSYPFAKQSQELFWDFVQEPSDSSRRKQAGVYSSKLHTIIIPRSGASDSAAGSPKFTYKIIMLDTRSNKDVAPSLFGSKNDIHDDSDFLGEEQWQWLAKELQSDVDLILLGSSIQALPTDKLTEELWGMFPNARRRLLSLIVGAKCPNVLILSGDVHYAEVSKAKCKWNEIRVEGKEGDSSEEIIPRKSTIWELTSSGLTHTFYMQSERRIDHSNLMRSKLSSNSNDVWSQAKAFIYNIYQASFPSRYREQRYGDHYSGLNFGLIDINIDDTTENSATDRYSRESCVNNATCVTKSTHAISSHDIVMDDVMTAPPNKVISVTFRAMNSEGQAIIEKKIPLKPKTVLERGRISDLECEPFWGNVPHWRLPLMYLMVFAPVIGLLFIHFGIILFVIRFLFLSLKRNSATERVYSRL